MAELRVLTLNCWGVFVPFACKKRKERLREIGKTIGSGIYDVAILQEIWSQTDYKNLCDIICPTLPYAHYFHGGIIGTGLCIFSKHEILETAQHQFSLNGYAHKIFCGDWLGAKSVTLAKLIVHPLGIRVNIYNTHLHAQYSPDKTYNAFDEHRCLQSYEMAKYIRETSSNCDAVIVGGDFNTTPKQIGYQLITSIGNLEDSWTTQKDKLRAKAVEPTCERPDNCLGPINLHGDSPEGIRIDYLLHRQNPGFEVECKSCELAMRKIRGSDLPYSDHEGVEAIYTIRKNKIERNAETRSNTDDSVKHVEEGMSILQEGMKKARSGQKFWLLCAVLLSGFLIMMMEYKRVQEIPPRPEACRSWEQSRQSKEGSYVLNKTDFEPVCGHREDNSLPRFYIFEFVKVIAIVGILFSLQHSLITLAWELVALRSVIEDMKMFKKFLAKSADNAY